MITNKQISNKVPFHLDVPYSLSCIFSRVIHISGKFPVTRTFPRADHVSSADSYKYVY
jgi:enamine deaminase RidA (YjgF/YER057c/UK114 family)